MLHVRDPTRLAPRVIMDKHLHWSTKKRRSLSCEGNEDSEKREKHTWFQSHRLTNMRFGARPHQQNSKALARAPKARTKKHCWRPQNSLLRSHHQRLCEIFLASLRERTQNVIREPMCYAHYVGFRYHKVPELNFIRLFCTHIASCMFQIPTFFADSRGLFIMTFERTTGVKNKIGLR